MTIRAAGLMLITKDNRALFLRRSAICDNPGLWCFPGGKTEVGETIEETAERETLEEIGPAPYSNPKLLMRRVDGGPLGSFDATSVSSEPVDYTTFVATVEQEFIPRLNEEHSGYAWADMNNPPEPLHPGCRVALARPTMNELDVARAMAAGDLISPQQYSKNLWLFAIRISGTGLAYRDGIQEYVWRDASIYLDPEFQARAMGLPVIFDHPETQSLTSEEYQKRNVGNIFLTYVKGDELWGIAKILDKDAAAIMANEQLSTSPGVVFSNVDNENETITLSNGQKLLIEGNPKLLDHIAICGVGVWDKGGKPTGVLNNLLDNPQKETIGMAENTQAVADSDDKVTKILDALKGLNSRMDSIEAKRDSHARRDAARKDKFARRDGESYKDFVKRCDADESAMCDELCKAGETKEDAAMCAKDARKGAIDAMKRADGESFEEWAREEEKESQHREDKHRKDAETKAEQEREDARKDAAALAVVNADLAARLARAEAAITAMTTETPASERNALAEAQARADSVAGLFGKRASAPVPGERAVDYRKRQLNTFKTHSSRFANSNLSTLDEAMLGPIEDIVYADAVTAAKAPDAGGAGILIPITEKMGAREITRFTGDPMAWMQHFMTGAQIGRFNRNPKGA